MSLHQDLIERDRKVTFHASTHLRDFAHGDAPGATPPDGPSGVHPALLGALVAAYPPPLVTLPVIRASAATGNLSWGASSS